MINRILKRPHIAFPMLCILIVLSGYTFNYSSGIYRQISLISLCLEAVIWAYFSLKRTVLVAKIFLTSKNHNFSSVTPEMKKLPGEMKFKLDTKHPFVLREGMNNAYYDFLHRRVVLGDVLFSKLEKNEIEALVAHEVTHAKKHPWQLLLIEIALVILVVLTLRRQIDLLFLLVWASMYLAILPYVSRRFEYQADAGAAHEAGVQATISLLKKIQPEEYWGCETISHPSALSRIDRLLKLQTATRNANSFRDSYLISVEYLQEH